MIFDIIVILIFITLIIINVVRGAAKSLAGILTVVVSYFASTALGKMAGAYLYDIFVKPALTQAVTNAVSNVSADAANGVVSALPSWLTGLLSISAEDFSKLLKEPINNVSGTVSDAVNQAVQPVATGILTFFITILLFLIIWIILRKILVKPIVGLFRLPVLNFINRLLGFVLGAVDAFLLVSMLAYLTKLIIGCMSIRSSWFNESTIYNSFIFYHFYSGNIFTWISSLITG